MKEVRPFTAKMQGKVGGWVLDGGGARRREVGR